MLQPPPCQLPKIRQLLCDWIMGVTVGVLFGGMLLITHVVDAHLLVDVPQPWLARLVFLILAGFSFGLGAVLTGTLFLLHETYKP
jgi:uncharacterized membrane protein YedE/YeeE